MSIETIRYAAEPRKRSLGRNGYVRTTGAEVSRGPGYVTISPLDSRGNPSRCEIVVPYGDVERLALALMEVARSRT